MANETHNLRIGIDASQAKRGAAAYAAAIDKIAKATRDFDKMSAQMGKNMSKSGSFAAVSRDLAKLNSLRLNPSLAKNVQALSTALSGFRGPSRASVSNLRSLMTAMGRSSISPTLGRNLTAVTAALSGFRGPNRGAANTTQQFLRTINGMRLNNNVGSGLASLSATFKNFQGPSSQVARNIQAFAQALAQVRVPAGLGRLSGALGSLNGRFGSTSAAAIRLGGSVNGIPWGRASAGAIQLTGNLRGLENAMSLSYQMGSQLRALFGALTISGFTSGVIEATTTSDRLRNVLTAVSDSTEEVTAQMEYAENVSRRYGLNYLEVERNLGRFTAATRTAGLSAEQSNFIFESLGRQSRLFGLDVQQQARAMLAITQGFQKGTIRAEEFRSQLGEQIPVWQFMVEAIAELKGVDPSKIDLNKMMEEGQVGPDAYVLMFQKMEEAFGEGIANAMRHPLVAMENLRTSWVKFLELVGQSGVMDALAKAATSITDVMDSPKFQGMAEGVAQGLSQAIIKVGDAAAWALENIETLGKVFVGLLGAKAISTVVGLGTAFGALAGNATASVLSIVRIGPALMNMARGASLIGGISIAVAGLAGAFAVAGVAAAAALAVMWDNTVKVGDTTTTVGAMARVAFEDMGNWAQWAGQQIMTLFSEAAKWGQAWFAALNQEVTQGTASWEDWAKTILGFIHLVGSTMVDVFRAAWRLVVQNTLDAFGIIVKTVQGIGAAFNMIGAMASFDRSGAAAYAREAADLFFEVEKIGQNAFKETVGIIDGTFSNAAKRTDEYVKGLDWVTQTWNNNRQAVIDYFDELAKRSTDAKYNPTPEPPKPIDTTPPSVDTAGLNPILGGGDDAGGVGKRAKAAADATEEFLASQARLNQMLAAGKINAAEYADALNYYRGKLEETINPYGAMIRSMQEEANLLRLNSREQRIAADFQNRRNQLMEQGVVLTAKQTDELKKFVEQLDKLKNPSPLQAWVDGMQDFGDAVESAGVKAMEGLSDSIADLIVDGKADWESLFKSILKDLIKLGLNEVWKGLFGGGKVQTAVNAPDISMMTDPTSTANASVMAVAVADGIRLAGGGLGAGTELPGGFDIFGGAKAGELSFTPASLADSANPSGLFSNVPISQADPFPVSVESIATIPTTPTALTAPVAASSALTSPIAAAATPVALTAPVAAAVAKPIEAAVAPLAALPGNAAAAAVTASGMPSAFNATSIQRATGIHPDLLAVVSNAQKYMPEGRGFQIPPYGGLRTKAEQAQLVASGASKTMNSNHLTGRAIDLMGSPFGKGIQQSDIESQIRYDEIAAAMKKSSAELGIPVNWGGDWKSFVDKPHFELPRDYTGRPAGALPGAPVQQMSSMGLTPGATPYQNTSFGVPAPMTSTASLSGLPGGMGLPGTAGGAAGALGGGDMAGLADSFKAEMTPAFQEIATAVPGQFQPSMTQVAQQLPQKITENSEGFSDQLLAAAQPGNMQASQDNAQKYMQANSQAAQDFAMKMQQQTSGMGGMGGGGGGIGGILGGLFGTFAAVGATVGSAGGSRRSLSTILGDPDAEPIIAHRGELITPANEVNRMRRMGEDAVLLDNAAVRDSSRRSTSSGTADDSSDGSVTRRNAPARPVVNFHISTPNADSFRASQSQIAAKAGAAAYRDSVRNN